LHLFILSFSAFLLLGGIEEDRLLSIESAINRGVAYLVGNQNEDGSVSLDNDETFKVWETANVLLAVHITDRTKTAFWINPIYKGPTVKPSLLMRYFTASRKAISIFPTGKNIPGLWKERLWLLNLQERIKFWRNLPGIERRP
jgi:hypothetical protein